MCALFCLVLLAGCAAGDAPPAYGQTETVALLRRRGADPARVDGDGNRALDYALTGTLYRSTLFGCQEATVRTLVAAHAPPVVADGSLRWAKMKRCKTTLALLR